MPTGCSTQYWTCLFSDEFSTEGMELQFSQCQHQSTPVPSTDKVCSALTYVEMWTGRVFSVESKWCIVKVGRAMKGRGRFICGND